MVIINHNRDAPNCRQTPVNIDTPSVGDVKLGCRKCGGNGGKLDSESFLAHLAALVGETARHVAAHATNDRAAIETPSPLPAGCLGRLRRPDVARVLGVIGVGVGVMGVGAGVLASHLSLHRDISAIYRELANLREQMAKLEGAVEGFMRGQIPRDAA